MGLITLPKINVSVRVGQYQKAHKREVVGFNHFNLTTKGLPMKNLLSAMFAVAVLATSAGAFAADAVATKATTTCEKPAKGADKAAKKAYHDCLKAAKAAKKDAGKAGK